MQALRKALALFARIPRPGSVKTRLAKAVGPQEATAIYTRLLRRTLGIAAEFKHRFPRVEVFVFFAAEPPDDPEPARLFPGPWEFLPQEEGPHLGRRMGEAMDRLMDRGFKEVVLVGTDLADLEVRDLGEAFESLADGSAVLGPALDGGFYLIGLSRPCPAVFDPPEWGTEDVCRRTEGLLGAAGFAVRRLTTRRDVDRPEDLPYLTCRPDLQSHLSVVIPTLKPASALQPLLESLAIGIWPGDEIVVVSPTDGQSSSFPSEPFQVWEKTRCISAPRGRGLQLHAGATAARGDLLFFLHDDCRPPPNFAHFVRKIASRIEYSLGCFQLAFDPSSQALDCIAQWANLRTRWLKLPYGDQGLFCRRETYLKAGGFRLPYLMEDVDFVRRCGRLGKLLIVPETIVTAPDRYLRKGVLRAALQNHLTMLLFHWGASNEGLYRFYYRDG